MLHRSTLSGKSLRGGPSDKGKKVVDEGITRRELKVWPRAARTVQKWQVLSEGWVKLNSEVGFRSDIGRASAEIIVRDSHGRVLLSAWRSLEKKQKPVCRVFG
jgi:hypothetical protein